MADLAAATASAFVSENTGVRVISPSNVNVTGFAAAFVRVVPLTVHSWKV